MCQNVSFGDGSCERMCQLRWWIMDIGLMVISSTQHKHIFLLASLRSTLKQLLLCA